ncbi:MAG: DUF1801 domain-containing protein [Granulosicoccus sp.]
MAIKTTSKKAQSNVVTPANFISTVEPAARQSDGRFLLKWFKDVTGMPAVMWGSNIIGFGRYHYEYESGRSGDSMITGFSPRKAATSIYIMPGYQNLDEYLSRLGKHKMGKSCLYVNKLSDIDIDVLEEIVLYGVGYMKENYKTWKK